MLILIIILFALAAMLGAYLLSYVLQGKETPKGIAFIHGPLAATGLILLIIYVMFYQPAPIISLILFLFAAIGGLVLIYRDLTGKSLPKWMALGHGFIALLGFIFLIIAAFYS